MHTFTHTHTHTHVPHVPTTGCGTANYCIIGGNRRSHPGEGGKEEGGREEEGGRRREGGGGREGGREEEGGVLK